MEGVITSWNYAAQRIYGHTTEEVIGKSVAMLAPPDRWDEIPEMLERARHGHSTKRHETVRVRKDGTVIDVALTISPVRDNNGAIIGASTIARDITARQREEAALRRSEERLRLAQQCANAGTWEWDITTGKETWPPEYYALYGLDPQTTQPSYEGWLASVAPEDRQATAKVVLEAIEQRKDLSVEFRIMHPACGLRWIAALGRTIYDAQQRPVRMAGIAIDVTDRKLAEERLQASLREKEVLLKEIHHWVKNSLQSISSLLSLQSEHVTDAQVLAMFRESQNRIRSMALIHEKLYASANLSKIDMSGYVRSLTVQLVRSYAVTSNIVPRIEVDPISLDIDVAIPCGLLLNELVCNALEHAFPDGRDG